jgi:hypothetical protein
MNQKLLLKKRLCSQGIAMGLIKLSKKEEQIIEQDLIRRLKK